ncbi:hypothetical protein SAMN06295909_1855 [Plantibacter sp. VKM Ac-1784]|uniref:Uncharacterized protein n=1 Tax=Plantibacter elymi (nom. nud.) TaxID=199708 RepID=A0ABY1RGD8_9MICO|nr:hypothetical protein [Plantibacter sp. VKM Ac-1784]SMQ67771.1 hypothetical protein SAMN06295909_1855 [Plantibacter sp. VKM Ac-1784]
MTSTPRTRTEIIELNLKQIQWWWVGLGAVTCLGLGISYALGGSTLGTRVGIIVTIVGLLAEVIAQTENAQTDPNQKWWEILRDTGAAMKLVGLIPLALQLFDLKFEGLMAG